MSATAVVVAIVLSQATPYSRLSEPNADGVTHCLWWPAAPIELRAHQDGTPEVDGEAEFAAISRSIATWQGEFAACASIAVSEGPRSTERYAGFNAKSPRDNENVILFRQKGQCRDVVPESDACWDGSVFYCANVHDCWPHQRTAIAITTNSFNSQNGRIFDADVEFNDAAYRFTATEAGTPELPRCAPPDYADCVFYDLQNTMTHELGHVFGLDHDSQDSTSTMYDYAGAGDTFMRSLDPASSQFVCDVYPAGAPPRDCVVERLDPELGPNASCGAVGALPVLLAALRQLRRRRRA